jgi:hypothetical protein
MMDFQFIKSKMNKIIILFFILISYFANANANDNFVNIDDQTLSSIKKNLQCSDKQLKRTKLISQYEVDYWLNQKEYEQIIDKVKSKFKYKVPKKFIYDRWQDEIIFKLPLVSDHTSSHIIFVVSHDDNLNLRLSNLRTKHTYFDEYVLDSIVNDQSYKYDNKKYNFFIVKNSSAIDKTLAHLYLFFTELDISKNNPENINVNVHFFEHEDVSGILEIDDIDFSYISIDEVIENKYKKQEMVVSILDCLDMLTLDKMIIRKAESEFISNIKQSQIYKEPIFKFNFLIDYYEYFILIFFIILNKLLGSIPPNKALLVVLAISLLTFSDLIIWLVFIYFISIFINRNIWVKKDDS